MHIKQKIDYKKDRKDSRRSKEALPLVIRLRIRPMDAILLSAGTVLLLIFGIGPFPAMGVRDAAIATVISQWAAVLAYVVFSCKTHQQFIGSLSQMFRLQKKFVMNILNRIYTLILNEVFFGIGETLYIRAFSALGPVAMDAYFVGSKIADVFFILNIQVVRVLTVKIALRMFIVVAFSALRAGGDSKFLTFLDCGVMWLVGIPVTFLAVHVLGLTSISLVLLLAQTEHLARFLLGAYRLKSGKWAVNLTKHN